MARIPPNLAWVVCHAQTRVVLRRTVACPAGGRVPDLECLGCRYLVTSSVERSADGWCEAIGPVDAAWWPRRPPRLRPRVPSNALP